MYDKQTEIILKLIRQNDILWSEHALEKLLEESIDPLWITSSGQNLEILEEYPNHERGSCLLAFHNYKGTPFHVVWGIAKGTLKPAVVITVYKPLESKWLDYKIRKK